MGMKRREFLLKSGMGALIGEMSGFAPGTEKMGFPGILSASEERKKLIVGLVGCGNRGFANAMGFSKSCRIGALCDLDSSRIKRYHDHRKICPDSDKVAVEKDYRKLLDRKEIDIISISTVDHWHVKIAAEALLAGKHVFCEKPLTWTIEENRYIRDLAQKTDRVFLVGTQQRTMKDQFLCATLMVRAGLLGKIQKVSVFLLPGPKRGPFPKAEIPSTLDWERWQGPVERKDYRKERCHATFRYWYEYAGGQFTDWGAHHIDCAQWALGEDQPGKGPVEVDGREVEHASELDSRGFPLHDDLFNTAVQFHIRCRFASGIPMDIISSRDNGILFEGTKGRIFVNRGKLTGKPVEEGRHLVFTEEDYIRLNHGKPIQPPKANFLRCIQEGGLPSSDVISHSVIMNTCHLCGIAARLKRVVCWDPLNERILDDDQAAFFTERKRRKGYELPGIS
ncbi:MAG: Gfo/Idh/MocA family oxidoreductase [Planctomycetia bacterium]|nr:Gfo/Idh/MocA family oxidoreductase [Planctomycetia bacterium]